MPIIDQITGVDITSMWSNPPQYVFRVSGTVAGKWSDAEIVPVVHVVEPADKIQSFEVHAELVQEGTEGGCSGRVVAAAGPLFLEKWAWGVRFIAAGNSVERLLGAPKKAPEIDFIVLNDHPVPWPWRSEEEEPREFVFTEEPEDNNPSPFPLRTFSGSGGDPAPDLIGRKLRVIRAGEVGTAEIDPGRVTITLDPKERIAQVIIDPDRPTS